MNKAHTSRWLAMTWSLLMHPLAPAAPSHYTLPLDLAVTAASKAILTCEASGYHVSVAVVDAAGQAQVQLKGARSTPHTFTLAYRKAYSVVTFAPNYGLETSAEVGELMGRHPALLQTIVTLPGVAPIPGAVAIKLKGEHMGAIGVSGAPGGEKDEACARAGIASIADRLAQ